MRLGALFMMTAALLAGQAVTAQAAPLDFKQLNFKNGWKNSTLPGYDQRRAAAAIDNNDIIHLRGAIEQDPCDGTKTIAFRLPENMRPRGSFYIIVAGFNFADARLLIQSDGNVRAEGGGDPACQFAQLDGVTFPRR